MKAPASRAIPLLHTSTITVRLGDTDAAGRLYFAAWLVRTHEIFEEWLDACGLPLRRAITMPVIFPVVECHANFYLPALLGDRLDCALGVREIKEKSFCLETTARRDTALVAKAQITHVAVERNTGAATLLPDFLREKIQPFVR